MSKKRKVFKGKSLLSVGLSDKAQTDSNVADKEMSED